MTTLYRKYRPQSWEEVVGQNHIKLTLQREIETGQLAHAFLFFGPRGIGKTTLARLLAKALNCEKRPTGQSEPCNQCVSCQEITAGHSLDVMEIDAASHTSVENVRENVIESARFSPGKSKYKIFIIDEVHMLSTSAFNALLKTLEEPPSHVIFVLATTELHKLPLTIVSRCQRFDFKKVNIEDVVKRLKKIADEEKIKIDKKILERVAYRSEGCLRDAESLLGQIFSLGIKNITEEEAGLILPRSDFSEAAHLLDLLVQKNLKEALLYLNQIAEEGADLFKFCEDLIEFSRILLLINLGAELEKLSFSLEDKLLKTAIRLAKEFSSRELIRIIETFLKQKSSLRASPVPQLPLELAVVALMPDNNPLVEKPMAECKKAKQPEPKTEIATEPKPPQSHPELVSVSPPPSLNLIQEKWEDFLKKVQEYNHSLPLILRMSEPLAMAGQKLRIKVKFSFHRDKLNEPKLRALAEKALSEVLGQEALIEAVLAESNSLAENTPIRLETDDLAQSIAVAFGGTVVD